MEAYCKIVNIEALTSVDMVLHQILSAALTYSKNLSEGVIAKQNIGVSCKAERALLERLSAATGGVYENCEALHASAAHPGRHPGAAL